MHWNNRIIRHKDENGNLYYAIHEVYYEGEDQICGLTEPIDIIGDSVEDLKKSYDLIGKAFASPVLDRDKIKFSNLMADGDSSFSSESPDDIDGLFNPITH